MEKEHAISYKIASGIVKDMDQKECLGLSSPMTKDRKILEKELSKSIRRNHKETG